LAAGAFLAEGQGTEPGHLCHSSQLLRGEAPDRL